MLTVAIDTKPLSSGHSVRGIGVHTKQLLNTLKQSNKIKLVEVDFEKEDLSKYDIVHFTSFNPYLTKLPSKKISKKWVLTIHDLIPLIYPKQYPSGLKGKINFINQKRKLKLVDKIITISETSKKDICRFLKVNSNKVEVIYLAPPKFYETVKDINKLKEVEEKYKLPDRFCLYVGDVNYNKNINSIAQACIKINIPLVMVGKSLVNENVNLNHKESESYAEFLQKYANNKNIIRTGYVEDGDLNLIYNLASVYLAPSFYEGFDLNALQALKVGLPVVASKIQVHKEILKNACLYVNPNDSKVFEESIRTLLTDEKLRSGLVKEGFEVSAKFSWSKTAFNTVNLYEKLF